MAKIDTLRAVGRAESTSKFLSDITGLPIASAQSFPELVGLGGDESDRDKNDFSYHLALGDTSNSYKICFDVGLTDEWTPKKWLFNAKWQVLYNDQQVFKRDYADCSRSFRQRDLVDVGMIDSYLDRELQLTVGGPGTEIPFMDFESYVSESLGGQDSYFANVYLALMIHMKERGLQMPPILSKRPEIAGPMAFGDIEAVNKALTATMLFEASGLDAKCQAHIGYEADSIRSRAKWENRKRDPAVDLAESFPDLDMKVIKEGKTVFRPSNILVVENNLNCPGSFIQVVAEQLENDGGHRGDRLIREVNLPESMQICATGKIDMVLFDWRDPSFEEALMVDRDRNPWFDLVNGAVQGALEIGEDRVEYGLSDGRVLSKDDLVKEADELDIRSRWADMIADACRESKVEPPPHIIVKGRGEISNLAKTISQKLAR